MAMCWHCDIVGPRRLAWDASCLDLLERPGLLYSYSSLMRGTARLGISCGCSAIDVAVIVFPGADERLNGKS